MSEIKMSILTILLLVLLTLELCKYGSGLAINFSGSGIYGDPAPGRSPGPPDLNTISNDVVPLVNLDRALDECDFGKNVETVENDVVVMNLTHDLFKNDMLVPGVTYTVALSKSLPESLVDIYLVSQVDETAVGEFTYDENQEYNICGSNVFKGQLKSMQKLLNWTFTTLDRQQSNITFRLKYVTEGNPTVYQRIYTFPIIYDCQLYLKHEKAILGHNDLPHISDCNVWFPVHENGHGLVVELIRLNVPCLRGFVHFSGLNTTQHQHFRSHKQTHLCGKLEELPESDRIVYFPSSHTRPLMHVHGRPVFAISYRLVDHCYNLTFATRNGSFDLQPSGELDCTFRIYLPYGNRVALKLQIGDGVAKGVPEATLNIQELKHHVRSCDGLLLRLHDGASTWSHCANRGDAVRQIEMVSRENKVILKVSVRGVSNGGSRLGVKMSYRSEPVVEVTDGCEFGYVALNQFCVTAVEGAKLPWSQAEMECVRRGGHLASIRSEHDQKIVDRILLNSPGYRDHNSYWVGASDKTHESDFRWTDGFPFSYSNWFPGWAQHRHYNRQPNDDSLSEQDCVELRRMYSMPSTSTALAPTFMWNDRDCSTPNFFLCEKPKSREPLEENWAPDCNKSVVLSRQQPRVAVSSPGFPRQYPDNIDCDTNIAAPPGYRIVLDFEELVIENEPTCSYDYLEVIETFLNSSAATSNSTAAAATGRRLCGDWSSKLKLLRYVSQGSRVKLRFSSDYSHHFGGYKARVSMENAMQCSDDRLLMFNNSCYLIVNYPEVTWTTAEQICRGMKAVLASILTAEEERFITTNIRKNPEYRTSALYWLGGRAEAASTGFKWIDGNSMDYARWLPGGALADNDVLSLEEERCHAIRWMASPTPELPSGFYWTSQRCDHIGGYICKRRHQLLDPAINFNKTVNGTEGTVESPNFPGHYYNNLDFTIRIVGPERTRLVIKFKRIDIESQLECLYDHIELKSVYKNNKQTTDSVKLCGSHDNQMRKFDFVSETNEAKLTFHSDYSVTSSGFSLEWHAVDVAACPTQTLTAKEGAFTSPNYPDFLLAHLDCTITIQAPPGKRVWLQFFDTDLGQNYEENEITNAENTDVSLELQLGKHSTFFRPFETEGFLTEGTFLSTEDRLKVKLRTGDRPNGAGFRAVYKITADFKDEKIIELNNYSSGVLLHLNYPDDPPPNVDFLQHFIAPLGHTISLELHHLKLSDTECVPKNGMIEVFDNYAEDNGTTWKMCLNRALEDPFITNTPIYISSFLNTLHLRQRNGVNGIALNGSVKVQPDKSYRKKLLNHNNNEVESCDPNPCQNGGKCVSKKSKRVCQCIGHFTGLFCALNKCELDPCVFGTCELTNTSYKCHCKAAYLGPTCEQKRKPCEGNPCESRGTCIEKGDGFQCQCHAWWEGPKCEKRMLHIPYKPLSERMLHEPFWLGLMTVFVVMGVIGLVWCAKRHFPEKIEKLLAEEDSRNRTTVHSLRSTSVRDQLAAASNAGAVAVTPSPGPGAPRTLFGRLGIRKPSILSLTSPHASSGYAAATARTFSLDDLLKPSPRRSPSPKKKRNNSTPTKKNAAEKKQILQQLISPNHSKISRKVSLGELIQMSERKLDTGADDLESTALVKETKFIEIENPTTALTDPKLEKKVTFARLLNKVSAEMSSGSDMEMGIMQSSRLGCVFARPSSTPPSPAIDQRSPNSTSSNQGSGSFTSSDLAIPTALSSSISDLLHRQSTKLPNGRQKPSSADSILAMFRNFSSSSAAANLSSSLKVSPSTTPTASSPQDDMVGDDESSTSSAHTPVSFSSGPPESPILHRLGSSTIEVPVLDALSAHRSSTNGSNLLHPPTILLEIPSTINKCLSPIRELPTPLPSPMPSPALTPIMRRSMASSPIMRRSNQSSLDEAEISDDRISVEIPNISISGSDNEDDQVHCSDIVIDPQAEDGLILEEAAAMHQGSLHKPKVRPAPLGICANHELPPITITIDPPPLVIPTLTIQTPSPTHTKSPTHKCPGSPPPHRSQENHFQFPPPRNSRKMFKDFDKPTSLDLPCAPPMITITSNLSEVESDAESISPAVKSSGHLGVNPAGMTYLSPFSMGARADHNASESNLSSSGYSSMASPGPSRCGSSNPLCPSEMEDQGPPGSGPCLRRQSVTPVIKSSSNESSNVEEHQQEQRRGRSDSETLSDDPLIESNDEGIGTDHIDEKIDDGDVKSAKELEVFMTVESDTKTLIELPLIPTLQAPRVAKCVSVEDPIDRLLPPPMSKSKNSLQLPSIIVNYETPGSEKLLSPMSSRSESPLSDKTSGLGRFSPQFYGKNKDLLPFTDSDGLYDFPSSDKVNIATSVQHKKIGKRREKRTLRNCKTPSPTKQHHQSDLMHNRLDVPSKDLLYFKVPPPRKLSPKRRLARSQVVSSSSSSDSRTSTREARLTSSSPSPDTIRWSSPIGWLEQKFEKSHEASDEDTCDEVPTASSTMLSKSLDFTHNNHSKHQKISRLRAISHQIRFLRRLEMSLKRRERTISPSDSLESGEEESSKATSPLLQQKSSKVEIRKSSSISKLPSNSGGNSSKVKRGKYKKGETLKQEEGSWQKVVFTGNGHSD